MNNELLLKNLRNVPDFPVPGIQFKDVSTLYKNPKCLKTMVNELYELYKDKGITKVVGIESRGFVVGAALAYKLGAGFVMCRKPGKLPRDVYSQTYSLEYGTDELQIHKDALSADDKVLIIDDLVATGGTAVATAKLVEQAGAEVMGFGFILELCYLNPRKEIGASYDQDVFTLIKVK